jgi:hypothetical protein
MSFVIPPKSVLGYVQYSVQLREGVAHVQCAVRACRAVPRDVGADAEAPGVPQTVSRALLTSERSMVLLYVGVHIPGADVPRVGHRVRNKQHYPSAVFCGRGPDDGVTIARLAIRIDEADLVINVLGRHKTGLPQVCIQAAESE